MLKLKSRRAMRANLRAHIRHAVRIQDMRAEDMAFQRAKAAGVLSTRLIRHSLMTVARIPSAWKGK